MGQMPLLLLTHSLCFETTQCTINWIGTNFQFHRFAIIQGCWNKNGKERPSFADLVVRLDTLLARRSYQQEITEINGEIHSGIRRLSAPSTVHSTSDQQNVYVFEPASTQSAANMETSLKTPDGYLKVIADQAGDTADEYSSFTSSGKYENDLRLLSSKAVKINNDEDAYGYVNVTPEPPSRTTSAVHARSEDQHQPAANAGNGLPKAAKAPLQEDKKKPAPLPKPSLQVGSLS